MAGGGLDVRIPPTGSRPNIINPFSTLRRTVSARMLSWTFVGAVRSRKRSRADLHLKTAQRPWLQFSERLLATKCWTKRPTPTPLCSARRVTAA